MGRPRGRSKYRGLFKSDEKIGNWTVVDDALVINKHGMVRILCKCKCGYEAQIRADRLNSAREHNKSRSSRVCAGVGESPDPAKLISRKAGDVPGSYVSRMIRGAASRNLSYTLSPQYLSGSYSEGNTSCALSGLPIDFEGHTASVDRIDSAKGYEEDNTQWVHKAVNQAKGSLTQDQFVYMCHLVAENQLKPEKVQNLVPPTRTDKTDLRKMGQRTTVKDFLDKREQQ